MNEARPFASLSSGLLARKGTARPAMRPQGYHSSQGFEDLGWNDMGGHEPVEDIEGDDLPEHVPSSIAALTPAPKLPRQDEEPEVVAQQRAVAEAFEAEVAEEIEAAEELAEVEVPAPAPIRAKAPAEIVPLPKRRVPAATQGRKAAFTLRLDGDRHLRLRLATAVTGRSAQQLVLSALDELLATLPEIEALAERVPAAKAKRN
ncbi:MAG TPA: hypothetical protein VLK25_09710 [Allosphingosinicella sp.]|nr:hypothetical protein [Allosphingosinicella sp.]